MPRLEAGKIRRGSRKRKELSGKTGGSGGGGSGSREGGGDGDPNEETETRKTEHPAIEGKEMEGEEVEA